jgi:hypothetical protein
MRVAASLATAVRAGCPAMPAMARGSSASTVVPRSPARITTLHGSSSPIVRSAKSAPGARAGVAGAEDEVVLHVFAELVAHGGADVDLGEHAESLFFQRLPDPADGIRERGGGPDGHRVFHVSSGGR